MTSKPRRHCAAGPTGSLCSIPGCGRASPGRLRCTSSTTTRRSAAGSPRRRPPKPSMRSTGRGSTPSAEQPRRPAARWAPCSANGSRSARCKSRWATSGSVARPRFAAGPPLWGRSGRRDRGRGSKSSGDGRVGLKVERDWSARSACAASPSPTPPRPRFCLGIVLLKRMRPRENQIPAVTPTA